MAGSMTDSDADTDESSSWETVSGDERVELEEKISQFPAIVTQGGMSDYHKYGILAEALRHVIDHHDITPEDTTSDVCHRILKPATVGTGWENIPILTNPDLRYYNHDYRNLTTGTVLHCGFQKPDTPPPGSRSFCEVPHFYCEIAFNGTTRFSPSSCLSSPPLSSPPLSPHHSFLHRCCSKIHRPVALWGPQTSL